MTNSLTSMSNKRPLTAEEKAIAARMRAIIASSKELTEESVAEIVGVSQGQISHWTGGRLPVPAKRAHDLAAALGITDPAEISIAFREIAPAQSSKSKSGATASQLAQGREPAHPQKKTAAVDLELLTKALETAMTVFRDKRLVPTERDLAKLASLLYGYVQSSRRSKEVERIVAKFLKDAMPGKAPRKV